MDRLQKNSWILVYVFKGLMIFLPVQKALFWLLIDWQPLAWLRHSDSFIQSTCHLYGANGVINFANIKWTPLTKLLAFTGSSIGSLSIWIGLGVLIKLFKNYSNGQIFDAQNVTYYRWLGWLCFLSALLLRPISEALMVLASTLTNPPGQRLISIGFGTPSIEDMMIGLLIIIISWVMAEGHRLEDEQRLTV